MTAPTPNAPMEAEPPHGWTARETSMWIRICELTEDIDALESQLLAARREVEALRGAAKDCADDLESEIRARYGHPDIHPAMRQKYERDMEPVSLARAALAATPEEKK